MFKYLIILVLVLVSCKDPKDYDLETEKGAENIEKLLQKAFNGNKEICSGVINTLSCKKPEAASIFNQGSFYTTHGDYYEQYDFSDNKIDTIPLNEYINNKSLGSIKFSELDIKSIPVYAKKARGRFINPEKYKSIQLASWEFAVTKDKKILQSIMFLCVYKKPQRFDSLKIVQFTINEEGKYSSFD